MKGRFECREALGEYEASQVLSALLARLAYCRTAYLCDKIEWSALQRGKKVRPPGAAP